MAKFKLTQAANRERAASIYRILDRTYGDARCTLDYNNPLELLVATILAAQCTDERVNIVTKDLFRKYPDAKAYAEAPLKELENAIRSCGFYRNKARNIAQACRSIVEDFDGEVPGAMDELLSLDGVGRKTANVLLGECYNTPGIIVDTHCRRVSTRLRFTRQTDPNKIEQDLMKIWPEEYWTQFSHCLVFHGRSVCTSRSPACSECPIATLCPFPESPEGRKIAT